MAEKKRESLDEKTEVTLTVAECGEFHSMGEFHENITTVDEAITIFQNIPPERLHGIRAIGIRVHNAGDPPDEVTEWDILTGNTMNLELLDHIPDISENPKAMNIIAELAAKLPSVKVIGKLPGQEEVRKQPVSSFRRPTGPKM